MASSYEEDYVSLGDIPNVMECYVLDQDRDYDRIPVTGIDKSRLTEASHSKELDMYGLTKVSTVKRELTFAMNKARSIRKFVIFEAGMDAIVCQAGDVILFQHDIPNYGLAGGRIKKIEPGNIVTLDRSPTLESGKEYCLRVRRSSDNAQLVFFFTPSLTGPTSVIDFEVLPNGMAEGDVYALGEGLNIAAGIVSGVNTTTREITLDSQVSLTQGKQYSIRVVKVGGGIVVHTLTAPETETTNKFTLLPADTVDFAAGDSYVFGEVTKEAFPFRVTSMVRKDDRKAQLTAEQYVESVYSADNTISVSDMKRKVVGVTEIYTVDTEGGTNPDPVPVLEIALMDERGSEYEIPPDVLPVVLTEQMELVGDVYMPCIEVSFPTVEMPPNSKAKIERYDVLYSIDAEDGIPTWKLAGSCQAPPFRIKNVKVGVPYCVVVKAVTNYGRTSDYELEEEALDTLIVPQGAILAAFSPPSDLAANPNDLTIRLTWTVPASPNLAHVEVWCAAHSRCGRALFKVRVGHWLPRELAGALQVF